MYSIFPFRDEMCVVRQSVMLRCVNLGLLQGVSKLLAFLIIIIVFYTGSEFSVQSTVTILGMLEILRIHITFTLPQAYQQFQEMYASIRRMEVIVKYIGLI